MSDHAAFHPGRIERLNDPRRLLSQLSQAELARLLDLHGDEDVLDLGSGTGFYTDRIAELTTGVVYAVELHPEMNEHYRGRGVPANVRLIIGDLTSLPLARPEEGETREIASLEPASADVACTIATWHEIEGKLDLQVLSGILRPHGRLVVVDWRRDPESWEDGPPKEVRFTAQQVVGSLTPYFPRVSAENVGRFMFAVTGER